MAGEQLVRSQPGSYDVGPHAGGRAGGQRGPLHAARAVVVDGDRDVADMVREVLLGEGLQVAVAKDGFDALALARDFLPDVIILGDRVPKLAGAAFVSRYRRQPGRHAPLVLVTTAYNPAGLALQIGADAVVRKPFELDQFLAAVGRLSLART